MVYPVPQCDILIHAGDFTRRGALKEIEEFNDYLASLKNIKHKIVIAGNHEVTFDPKFSHLGKTLKVSKGLLKNCIYLEDEACKLMGLNIYGSPWQPKHANNAFQLHRGKPMAEKWEKIPDNTDILISKSNK
jgi:hypothetical protein